MNEARSKSIGGKFRKTREKLSLTQLEVADKAGLNVSHYAKVERGELTATLETLEKISKALKLKISELI